MKRVGVLVVAAVWMCGPAAAEDATSQFLAAASTKANVLMQVSYDYVQDASGPIPAQKYTAQAICITREGLFMTFGIGAGMQAQEMKDLRLAPSGESDKSIKAEFLWSDRETGISFLRATEAGDFVPATFVASPSLKVGTKIASVGLFEDDAAHTPYVGVGYISATLRVPSAIVLITGGSATNTGSPILNEAGEFIGITKSQFLRYQVSTNQGIQEMSMNSRTLGQFFQPSSEFVHVVEYAKRNPARPRVLSWIGVLNFRPVDDNSVVKAEVPAVAVGRVAPEGPASSTLKEGDLIVKVDGKGLEKLPSPGLIHDAFVLKLVRMAPNQTLTLTIRRDGKESDVQVVTAPQPQDDTLAPRFIVTQLGFRVRERAELDKFIMPPDVAKVDALVVLQVVQGSPADRQGLRTGDLIVSVNTEAVSKVAAFKTKVTAALTKSPTSAVTFVVRRGSETHTFTIPPATP